MRRHGATVVGADVRELVFRSIAMCQNAESQMRALAMGNLSTLTPGETKLAAASNLSPNPLARTWEYWTARAQSARRSPTAAWFSAASIDIVFSPCPRRIGGDASA